MTSPGGHAASPHETRDAVVAAAHVVTALQTIVARRLSPLLPAVVSVTSMHGGSAFNILPESVVLRGTCRSFDAEVAERLPALVQEVAEHAARALGCEARTVYRKLNARGRESPEGGRARASRRRGSLSARGGGGRHDVLPDDGRRGLQRVPPERVPGAFAFVGAAPAGFPRGPHHAPDFDFDERALPHAALLLAGFARDVLAD